MAGCVGPEYRNDVSITYLWELITLLREATNVFPEGFAWLLLITLQILGVDGSHIGALEVVGEDLLEILLTIDLVSLQMVQPCPGQVG
jgi:hypothetical protein